MLLYNFFFLLCFVIKQFRKSDSWKSLLPGELLNSTANWCDITNDHKYHSLTTVIKMYHIYFIIVILFIQIWNMKIQLWLLQKEIQYPIWYMLILKIYWYIKILLSWIFAFKKYKKSDFYASKYNTLFNSSYDFKVIWWLTKLLWPIF